MMMVRLRAIFVLCISLLVALPSYALVMKGKVYDRETQRPLARVYIINLNTQMAFQTDSTGLFTISVKEGQIIKFKRYGYLSAQVKISGQNLPYYSIGLQKGVNKIPDVEIKGHNFRIDSIENRETYKWALDHYQLSGLSLIEHPFDALSKKNRQIWAFQKRFQYFEKQKFIDYVFNKKLITKITGLTGHPLDIYWKLYRPTYAQIKSWTTYEFYDYIKKTGGIFKFHHQGHSY